MGQKRFSVEGGESLLPALDAIVERGSELGAKEFIIGMAHRGRLNTLAHILNKPYTDIFEEFAGKAYDHGEDFDGDVKYHMGYSTDIVADTGLPVHITLAPNPSHLEAVDPVVEGIARARIDREHKTEDAVVPILVHGDAAVAGQGVVYELVQMAELDGYRAGGTIHLVVNNQVGFTTNYLDARTSIYCTDVAKATHCPVFHVNADDAEAVVTAVGLHWSTASGGTAMCSSICSAIGSTATTRATSPSSPSPSCTRPFSSTPMPGSCTCNSWLRKGPSTVPLRTACAPRSKPSWTPPWKRPSPATKST